MSVGAPSVDHAVARRAYTPRRHPGVRGRWDRASIVQALLTWTTETGRSPRRRDWTGERPSEASPAQRKWMREHPRWPSASCVSRHFGAWSTALQAAQLPVRSLVFETSAEQRVWTSRRLAVSGWTQRAIADALGVSVSSVRNYLNARRCPRCGGVLPSPRAEVCRPCHGPAPTVPRSWTRPAVREAIGQWFAEYGRGPSYRDWTPSPARPGRWEAENPRWPSAATVCDLYADHEQPWTAALLDAGVPPRFRRWSDDAIRQALAAFWAQTGRPPEADDLRTPAWNGPSAATLGRRFGGVEAAWHQLGPVSGAEAAPTHQAGEPMVCR
ncbi:MAG: helix-turn-helix transcriptional regulator [Solirubrobacterales bacterium]